MAEPTSILTMTPAELREFISSSIADGIEVGVKKAKEDAKVGVGIHFAMEGIQTLALVAIAIKLLSD